MIWQKALQQRLITHFSVEQRLVAADKVLYTGRRDFAPRILVGRGHCQYLCLNLEKVPRAKRQQALKLQIDTYTPWTNTGFTCAWHAGYAQVWLWDADRIEQLTADSQTLSKWKKPELLSEVVYWAKPIEPGVHIFKASNGFDLQYWHQGVLRASQWYPVEPGSQQLQRFVRSQGLPPTVTKLAPIEPQFLQMPWSGVTEPIWAQWLERRGPIALGLIGASVVLASLQINAIARWSWIEHDVQKNIKALEESANTLLSARSKARHGRLELQELQQLFIMPDPLTAQQRVYERLPQGLDLALVSWERNVNSVSLVVKGAITDTLSLVQALDQNGMTDVRVEPSRISNQYSINLRLIQEPGATAGKAPQ
jgi:hypothetical protein